MAPTIDFIMAVTTWSAATTSSVGSIIDDVFHVDRQMSLFTLDGALIGTVMSIRFN